MKRRSIMMILGPVMTLIAYGGGGAGTAAASSSGSETQTETETEEKTEADTTGQEGKEESRVEASGDTVISKLSNNQPDGNCITVVVEWLTDQVKKHTNGRVNIEICNNDTLGDAISCLEQLQYGDVDIVKANLSTITSFVDEYNALMTPYIYENTEHFWRVCGGDIGMGTPRGDKMKEKKLYGFTYYDGGTRCFYSAKKEVHSSEDMKGMLVGIQQSELMMSTAEVLGGQSVATAYSEVYPTLQAGVVNAAENSIANHLDQSHFEAAPYFVEGHHTGSASILVMSEKSRGKLSAEDLKIIDNTALESWEHQKELWTETKEESKQKLLEQDVAVIKLTEDKLKAFQDVCELIWCSYEGGAHKDVIDQITEAGK